MADENLMAAGKADEGEDVRVAGKAAAPDAFRTIEALMDCIERLMELLRETVKADEARRIYDAFFGE